MPNRRPPLPLGRLVARALGLVACALGLASCSGAPRAGAPDAPPAPDARALFRNPAFARPALSPDGERIAGVVTLDGLPVLVEKPLEGGELRYLKKIVEPGMAVRTVGWAGPEHIVVGFDRPGSSLVDKTRRSRMLAIRLLRTRPRDGESWVYPVYPSLAEPVLHWLPDEPEHVLLQWWEEGGPGASVERVAVRSGVRRNVVPPQPFVHTYYADAQGAVRVGRGRHREGTEQVLYGRAGNSGPFEPLVEPDPDAPELDFAAYTPELGTILVRAWDERGRKALYEFDLASRALGRKLYGHPQVDVGRVYTGPDGRLLAVEVEPGRPELVFFDEAAKREQAVIDAAFPKTVNRVVARDRAGRRALLRVSGDTQPPVYYLFDAARNVADLLYAELPDVKPERLSQREPVRYTARDGLEIPAYLTLPRRAEPRALPLVVVPHGGPSQRDSWGWDATAQFLAGRGFAVLQPNYRGSSGYGREHERKGDGEWGGTMQDDLIDGVRWLVEEGIADPSRVGIYGQGFGGYAALISAIKAPEVFRAAASYGAITDLVDLRDHPEHFRGREENLPHLGNLPRHVQALEEASPARRADRFRAQLLIAHGLEDPVVHPSQARALIAALEQAGVPFEQRLYRGEADTFVDQDQRIDFHQRLGDFFERHLTVPDPL